LTDFSGQAAKKVVPKENGFCVIEKLTVMMDIVGERSGGHALY
jgi:hypothetical protein